MILGLDGGKAHHVNQHKGNVSVSGTETLPKNDAPMHSSP